MSGSNCEKHLDHPEHCACSAFFVLSFCLLFTFFSRFLRVLFSFSAASLCSSLCLRIRSKESFSLIFFLIAIRLFFPLCFLLVPLPGDISFDPDVFVGLVAFTTVTRQGISTPRSDIRKLLETMSKTEISLPIAHSALQRSPSQILQHFRIDSTTLHQKHR